MAVKGVKGYAFLHTVPDRRSQDLCSNIAHSYLSQKLLDLLAHPGVTLQTHNCPDNRLSRTLFGTDHEASYCPSKCAKLYFRYQSDHGERHQPIAVTDGFLCLSTKKS
jgi:hypothetical protein